MEKFNFNQVPVEKKEEESLYDSRLGDLWEEYGFPGKPPKKDSEAEKRLLNTCKLYSQFLIDEKGGYSVAQLGSSEAERRKLHNQVAIMVVGKKRSGMDLDEATHIGDFAFEYAHGVTFEDYMKYKNREEY